MNTTQAVLGTSTKSNAISSGSVMRIDYLWKNLVIEKQISLNWLNKLYKGSVINAFWLVLSSPVK